MRAFHGSEFGIELGPIFISGDKRMFEKYTYDVIIRSIYDGDSVRVDIDLGFNNWELDMPVRFYGIDAPEIRGDERPEGLISKAWLEEHMPVGSKVLMKSHKDKSDKYGRYLATFYVDGVNINEKMVSEGFAEVYIP
jgi:micrococcal nuclease